MKLKPGMGPAEVWMGNEMMPCQVLLLVLNRGVDAKRTDAMSGVPLRSQSCLALSTLLLGVFFPFLLTQFCSI
jgi:hypothetical protein